ncbi:MAG: hypothetical protein FJ096_08505 [Deltaproteobacteria bacterium]|nr:hypothetical protein [Deltaproteobacteria bacterium]
MKRIAAVLTMFLLGCTGSIGSVLEVGGGGGQAPADGTGGAPSTVEVVSVGAGGDPTTGPSTVASSSVASTGSGMVSKPLACFDEPPPGTPEPPPLVDATGCPDVVPGANTVDGRKFLVAVPSNLGPEENPPVVFLWHWLGGSAQGFFDKAEVQSAVDFYRFIAVAMEAKGDVQTKWPFLGIGVSEDRVNQEVKFFDRALACVNKTYGVNRNCVSSVGVSAGALWTQVLASKRGKVLSSFESLSGGEGSQGVRSWGGSEHKMPAMVLWGGKSDNCLGVFSFDTLSKSLEQKLQKQGHFVVECVHNCGHSVPPFDPLPNSPTTFGVMWEFVLDHPLWLPAGDSPWKQSGFPDGFPEWCGMGVGSATQRTGVCTEPSGC